MHPEAYRHVLRTVRSLAAPPRRVAEFGSCNVNGSVRALFPGAEYVGVDRRPGPGVDVVADAAEWGGGPASLAGTFDCIVCTEALEHAPDAAGIVANAFHMLAPGGVLILTAATEGREPHGNDGGAVADEFYRNVPAADLRNWLAPFAFALVNDRETPGDVYAVAFKDR